MRKEDIKHGGAPHMQFTIFSFHDYLGQIKVERMDPVFSITNSQPLNDPRFHFVLST